MKKNIKMLLLDKDGTLVDYPVEPYRSSWDGLSFALSKEKRKEWNDLRDFYVGQKKCYDEWFLKQVALLKGLQLKKAEEVLFPIPYSKGVKEFFKGVNGNFKKGILSSGIDIVAKKACKELNLDFFISNILHIDKNVFTGSGENKVQLHNKKEWIFKISKQHKVSKEEICFVGDSFNDVPLIGYVGMFIGFNPKQEQIKKIFEEKADYLIYDFLELNNILKIK